GRRADAWQDVARHARRQIDLPRAARPVRGRPLSLARGRARERAGCARGQRADRGRRDHGHQAPTPRGRGRAVPPGKRVDARRPDAPRELPARRSRRAQRSRVMSALDFRPSELLERIAAGRHLEEPEADRLLCAMADGSLPPPLAGAILVALRMKGECAAEIRGFATAMRRLALRPELPEGRSYVDIVGTGGDGSGSLNLSTGSALLAAACGAAVVKHGNRSVSSRSGAADVLAALGLPVPLDERQAGECFAAHGFTFLFAPHYHPAM